MILGVYTQEEEKKGGWSGHSILLQGSPKWWKKKYAE
jgi:hypothetical protein